MIRELNQQAIANEFSSYWVDHTFGLVPQLSFVR